MVKRMKNVVLAVTLAFLAVGAAACVRDRQDAPAGMDLSQHVNLTYIMFGSGGNLDHAPSVFEEVNKVVKREINATINFKVYSYLDYGNKIQLAMNTGERWDMCFMAPWVTPMNYQAAVANLYLKDITEMLPECAPELYASMPADIWDAARVDGKIYGVINEQIFARAGGLAVEKALLEQVPANQVTRFSDLTKFLDVIKADPSISPGGRIPFSTFTYGNVWQDMYMQSEGYDDLTGGALTPGVVSVTDTNATVINQFETQAYKDYIEFSRKLIDDGYIYADDILNNRVETTNQRVRQTGTYKPGGEAEIYAEVNGRREFELLMFGTPTLTTSGVTATMFSINSLSNNPERALMFQNLLFKDKELYNLLAHGLEGRDWQWTSEEKEIIETIPNSKYRFGADWAIGNQLHAYRKYGQPADYAEQTRLLNTTSRKSVAYGFVFDPSPVMSKIIACDLVTKAYNTAFEQGRYTAGELNARLDEMLTKLNNAGANDIIAEKQKQLNAFLGK